MQYTANSLESHWMPFTANREFKEDPRLVVKGEGVYMWNHKGKKIIDGSSGLFCCPLGHGRKEIAEAVYEQLLENDYVSPFMTSTPGAFELAQLVTRITPEPMNHVFFVRNMMSGDFEKLSKIFLSLHVIQRALLIFVVSNTASTPYSLSNRLATTSNCNMPTPPKIRLPFSIILKV